MTAVSIPIRLVSGGSVAGEEPVSCGVSFARGSIREASDLLLVDGDGSPIDAQWEVLSRWPDGSVRWGLLDFLRRGKSGVGTELTVEKADGRIAAVPVVSRLVVRESEGAFDVEASAAKFSVQRDAFGVAASCAGSLGESGRLTCELTDARGHVYPARIDRIERQASGPVRATFRLYGGFDRVGRAHRLEIEARLSFFAGSGLLRIDLTLRNPRAARHRGGLWDLGDPGSVLFRDFSLLVRGPAPFGDIAWRAEPRGRVERTECGKLELFQASSGGENWKSRNHVNRAGEVLLPFRGYRVRTVMAEGAGLRASPVVALSFPDFRIAAAVPRFWQQFPKSIRAENGLLRIGLFPGEQRDLFELQAGEQKTHTVHFLFEGLTAGDELPLEWAHSPTVFAVDPCHLSATGAMGAFLPLDEDPHQDYLELMEGCVSGADSFYRKRETIDEYGWRHFGDVPADHEDLHYDGEHPVVSHYNNQYDVLEGLLLHFGRTGNPVWFELARDLALHVIDIDIYHTTRDRAVYNGGLFWHTDHYASAGRATHRTYTSDHPAARAGRPYGGGPSNEHNYTSGLLHFHYLTGDPMARDAVLTLAGWVIDMDDGKKSPLAFLDPGPTGMASSTADRSYHGPGRGAGNSLNALIDAFRLTENRMYLDKAEEIVRRSIHPADDIPGRNLHDLEKRWSYVVFLQAVGKYLDLKIELDERDSTYEYARRSLSHYALWMLENEVPYAQVLDRVEYPTETWPAHDVRKSVVFDLAARYGPRKYREVFLEKAEFFFRECMEGLSRFPTRTCTRPMAILLRNGVLRGYSMRRKPESEPPGSTGLDFGCPAAFLRQEDRVKMLFRTRAGRARLATALVRPANAIGLLTVAFRKLRERVLP
jgi:hypothetical protein